MGTILLAIFAIVVLASSMILANSAWDPLRGDATGSGLLTRDPTLIALQVIMLILGIFFASFHQRMKELASANTRQVVIISELKSITSSTRFWLAMSAAPVVFCVIVKLTEDLSTIAAVIVAFQNGFFWEKILPDSQSPRDVSSSTAA